MRVINIKSPREFSRIRRIALASQGLLRSSAFGSGLEGARRAIQHIGYVQIDTISVVERAHNHVVYARVPGFKPAMLDKMLINCDIFEYWTHAAAFIPIEDFRFSLPYKHAIRAGQVHWYKSPDRKLMKELLALIQSEGALRSRDLEGSAKKGNGWWDLKPAKKALEQLYMEGELMISRRDGFQKTYDLAERVLPHHINTSLPAPEEFAQHLVNQQMRCHGLMSIKGFTYLRKSPELRKTVKELVEERLSRQVYEEIKLPSGERYIINAGAFETSLPRIQSRVSILSPFDNLVIQRDRLKALFQFDYQIECYLPEGKRRYGYFSLPILYRDQFVGRMDCKAHRKEGRLEIKSLHLEPHSFDETELYSAFVKSAKGFMAFQRCDSVTLKNVFPKRVNQSLRTLFD